MSFAYSITVNTSESGSSPLTLAISATRSTGIAPAGVMFEATATSPESSIEIPYSDLHYTWTFGDPGNYTRMRSTIPWGPDKNIAYGPVVCHVFQDPGVYTVSCTVRDGVNTPRTETFIYTVTDQDAAFPTTNTAVISQAGNFAGAPSGASQYTSFAAALAAKSSNANQRYLFRRGETFTNPGIAFTANLSNLCLGAFGTGADPVINCTGLNTSGIIINNSCSPDEVIIADLNLQGAYDPVNPPGSSPNAEGIMFGGASLSLSGFKTIWNLNIEKFDKSIWAGGGSTVLNEHVYVGDTYYGAWHDYGLFVSLGGYIGFAGVSGIQPGDTVNGAGQNNTPAEADQGPFRSGNQGGPICFNLTDMSSFNSWAASDNNRSFQQCIRINSGQTDEKISVDRICTEGGFISTSTNTSNDNEMAPIFHVADKWHHIHSDQQSTVLLVDRGGQTFRNIIAVSPNNLPGSSTGMRRFVADEAGESVDGNINRRVEVYSYTFVDYRSDANARNRNGTTTDRDFDAGQLDTYTNRYMGNGIEYAPNMTTGGTTADGPLDTTSKWTPLYQGERWQTESLNTAMAYGAEVTADFQPTSGSPAIGSATGKQAIDDFYGTLRSKNTRGAVEN